MASSIPPTGDDPYKYKAEPIPKDKKKEQFPPKEEEPPKESAPFLVTYFLKFLERLMRLFAEQQKEECTVAIKNHLLEMRAILNTLKIENRSEDSPFLNQFSQSWHKLLEDASRMKKTSAWSSNFRSLIRALQLYPEDQEHTLGYYLTEYAGHTWLPFPYMEIILKLHREHQKESANSHLELWTKKIDELVY